VSDAPEARGSTRAQSKDERERNGGGKLFVVATPIGNLEDITLRALRVLREVDLVLAEDTRHSKTLLVHHGIETRLASLHAHTPEGRIATIADELAAGGRYALISDAGTPIVSDPGRELVQLCVARGIAVEALPGASAVLTALCVAGLAADQFRFVGFLARSGKKRRQDLNAIAHDAAATVLFEAPNRIADTLRDLAALCSDTRRAAVCRELTKLHEEVQRGTLRELAAHFAEHGARGEISVVVDGCAREAELSADDSNSDSENGEQAIDVDVFLEARLRAERTPKDVAKELATLIGIDKREAYKRVVEHRLRTRG
jgi:16S rRNA (cytidine1402-2'-O)-methyltransferase